MGRARRLMPGGMYVGGRRPTDAGHYGSGDIIQLFHDAQLFVSIKGVPQAQRAAAYELIDRIRQMTEAGQYHEAQVAVARLPDCNPALSPNLPRAQGISAIRDVCYWAIDKVQKENTGLSLSNAVHAVGQAASSVGQGLGSIATGVGQAAYGAAKGVVSGVGTVAHLAATPAMAAMAIARGDNVARSLGNAFTSAVKDIKDIAPLAQAVIGFVPGVGQGVNAALAAGAALAQGQRIDQALLSGVKGALGPAASAAFDSGLSIARGGSVTDAALNLARTQAAKLPGGAQAFDTAVALAHGQKIQDVLKGQAMNFGQQALERFVSHPLSPADPLTALGRAAKPALSALSPQVDMVARALLNTPALRSLPLDAVSRRLGGVPIEAVRSAVASIAGSAKSAGGRLIPQPAIANRLGAGHTLDRALAMAGANNAPPRYTHNPLRMLPGGRSDARGLDSSGMVWLVTSGDTMSKIAKTLTGNASRYPEMASLNNIKDANAIRIGQRLNVPLTWQKSPPPVVATVPVTTPNGTTVTVAVPTVIASAPPPATTPSGMPLIYQGVGPLVAIQKWQDIMRRVMGVTFPTTVAAGYGTFGPLTDKTTRAFQVKEGLRDDGKVGDETWNRGLYRFAQMGATTPVGTTGPNPPVPGLPTTVTLPPGALPPVPTVALPPIPSVVPIAVPGTSPPSSTPPFFPTFGSSDTTSPLPTSTTPATPSAPADTTTTVAPISTNAKPANNGDWLIPVAAAALAIFN